MERFLFVGGERQAATTLTTVAVVAALMAATIVTAVAALALAAAVIAAATMYLTTFHLQSERAFCAPAVRRGRCIIPQQCPVFINVRFPWSSVPTSGIDTDQSDAPPSAPGAAGSSGSTTLLPTRRKNTSTDDPLCTRVEPNWPELGFP